MTIFNHPIPFSNEESHKKLEEYFIFLLEENKKYNLTAIVDYQKIYDNHILDSVAVTACQAFNDHTNFIDVGSGGGIPGIVLALLFPEKQFELMEVAEKKISFLQTCIEKFSLHNCTVIPYDFKTAIRKQLVNGNVFLARASLPLNDLTYIFNGTSPYQESTLIYWGTEKQEFTTTKKIVIRKQEYYIEKKRRVLFILSR